MGFPCADVSDAGPGLVRVLEDIRTWFQTYKVGGYHLNQSPMC